MLLFCVSLQCCQVWYGINTLQCLNTATMLSCVDRYGCVTNSFGRLYKLVCRAGERGKYVTVCKQLQFTTLSSVERCKHVRVLAITAILYNVLNTLPFCVERLHRSVQYTSIKMASVKRYKCINVDE